MVIEELGRRVVERGKGDDGGERCVEEMGGEGREVMGGGGDKGGKKLKVPGKFVC